MSLNLFLSASAPSGEEPSWARRILGALGPTWLASPVRRLVQTLSLLLFFILFFYVCWPYGARHQARAMAARELIEAEAFLALDPLVSISTALAARTWVWSLGWAGALLLVCLVVPRGFCGYACPFGTLIDLFDWAIGKRLRRFRLDGRGWWVPLKHYVLVAVLVGALLGVTLSGFVAAIPVATRGMLYVVAPVQLGLLKGWHLVPPMHLGHYISIVLFFLVFALGLLAPRLWCRHVCPTGAVFSAASVLRVCERKVRADCTACGKCLKACPFDAIRPDFTTRPTECTFCQTCGGACPVGAIQFVGRWHAEELAGKVTLATDKVRLSRRGLAAGALAGVAAAAGIPRGFGAKLGRADQVLPVRPPGSVPEREFLRMCVRCGECVKTCPYNVLHPMGFEQGLEGLWTPRVVADWTGCEPTCNNCGQACPTGAIRALPLDEKRVARMGLAVVNERTCLPYAEREACQMCLDECTAAGYNAIEFIRVGVEVDEEGRPVADTGYLAPVVVPEKCNGCGLCQCRCYHINVEQKRLLKESAVVVVAGPGKEDRLTSGSYLALRADERRKKEKELRKRQQDSGSYLPDFLK